jgi:hypothetical protein
MYLPSHSGISGPAHVAHDGARTDFLMGCSLAIEPTLGINGEPGRVVVTFTTETAELTVISRRGDVQDMWANLAV